MSIQLTIPQMLDVLVEQEHPRAEGLIETAVQLALTLGTLIKEIVPGVDFKMENVDMWDAEITIGFSGPGPLPDALKGYDDEGWE